MIFKSQIIAWNQPHQESSGPCRSDPLSQPDTGLGFRTGPLPRRRGKATAVWPCWVPLRPKPPLASAGDRRPWALVSPATARVPSLTENGDPHRPPRAPHYPRPIACPSNGSSSLNLPLIQSCKRGLHWPSSSS